MTDHHKERISAFMDSELAEDLAVTTLDHLVSNEAMRNAWTRYHIISDAVQQKLPLHPDNQLAARISASIKDEPTVLSPVFNSFHVLLKPVISIAVAASVATIAVLGIQQYRAGEQPGVSTTGISVVTAQLPAPQPTVPAQPVVSAENVSRPLPMEIQSNVQMSRYIMNHNEYRTRAGVQGVMPYVRLVATENDE